MGYAKYHEDDERKHAQNVFGTRLDFQVFPPVQHHHCPYCPFETTSSGQLENHLQKEHRDAAIFLKHNDRVVPNRAVFRVRPVHLKVRCAGLPNGVEVSVMSNARPRTAKLCKDGHLLVIEPLDEEIVLVTLSIGIFRREYAISFERQVFQARITAYLSELIKFANTHISTWAWLRMAQFEADLLKEPGLTPDDARHRSGIYEYFVGLWLEQNQKPEFARHLEQAFEVLRDFDDSLALLIGSYFLYRVNAFQTISPQLPFPRLRRVVAFFSGVDARVDRASTDNRIGADLAEFVPCEIPITDADDAIFSAVAAHLANCDDEALRHSEIAQTRLTAGDDQAQCRLWLLQFQILRRIGRSTEARRFAERLSHCPVESFRTEADTFLKVL